MENRKIVVLDDDPTGTQTVYGVSVYTDWEYESIKNGFLEENTVFFVLTNSRSFDRGKAISVYQEIGKKIARASRETEKNFLAVIRGDSTLRGHYPYENQALRSGLKDGGAEDVDGEILIPFFPEGGRFTCGDTHYVEFKGKLVPAAETEFARDQTFGYRHSDLKEWIEEKTEGDYPADQVLSISLELLRERKPEKIAKLLRNVVNFGKVIVNAMTYEDLEWFVRGLDRAMDEGKHFICRTAAAFVKVSGGILDQRFLGRRELVERDCRKGGLIVAGSHVMRTTEQLKRLEELGNIAFIEFNQHLVLDEKAFQEEIDRAASLCDQNIQNGITTVVMTRRERFDLNLGDREAELAMAVKISDGVTAIVERLTCRPAFLIAKGGITSSEIGVKALKVKKAVVMGQVKPGIPVWKTGPESKFPGLAYIIFPGNVGSEWDLKEICAELTSKNSQ